MQKDALLLANIKQDLKIIIKNQIHNTADRRLSFIVPFTLLAILSGVFLKNIWIVLLFFSVAAYHIVRYVIGFRSYILQKRAIVEAIDRADISVSTEQFDHIAEEAVYEPHTFGMRGKVVKTVKCYYFASGRKWRLPVTDKHYAWSKNYYISSKGLENISIQGDEFYYISLQGYPDIAYIYPCKNFVFKEKATQNN
ncbi:MAG: hypothetical protein IKA82_01895 [Clostridia bacterium]|nr:hypothetical protein [Clostridia bacterium]